MASGTNMLNQVIRGMNPLSVAGFVSLRPRHLKHFVSKLGCDVFVKMSGCVKNKSL